MLRRGMLRRGMRQDALVARFGKSEGFGILMGV